MEPDSEVESIPHYENRYRTSQESDTPSFPNFVRRVRDLFAQNPTISTMVDVGSGPQILERTLLRQNAIPAGLDITTVDNAPIPPNQLLPVDKGVRHLQEDARNLSLPNNSTDLVVANHVLTFIGNKGLAEISRILKYGGTFITNIDYPTFFPPDLDQRIQQKDLSIAERTVLEHQRRLRDGDMRLETEEIVRSAFAQQGLEVVSCRKESDRPKWDIKSPEQKYGHWWAITAVKPQLQA